MASFGGLIQRKKNATRYRNVDRPIKPLTHLADDNEMKTDIIKICVLDDCPLPKSKVASGENAKFVVGLSQLHLRVWDLSTHKDVARSHRITWKVKAMCVYSSCNSDKSDSVVIYTGQYNTINFWYWRNDDCSENIKLRRNDSYRGNKGEIPNVVQMKSGHEKFISALHVVNVAPHMEIMGDDGKRTKHFPILISASEDMSCRMWSLATNPPTLLRLFQPKIDGLRPTTYSIDTKTNAPAIHFIFPRETIKAEPIEVPPEAPPVVENGGGTNLRGVVEDISVAMSSMMDKLSGDAHEDEEDEVEVESTHRRGQFGKHPCLFLGTDTGDIRCYRFDLRGTNEEATLSEYEDETYKPDDRTAVTINNAKVRYHPPKYLNGHTDKTNAFATYTQRNHALESLDDFETFLLSCSEDKTIKMWDIVRDGILMRTFAGGHSGVVYSIAVCHTWQNPDDDVIVSGGIDNKLNFWDVRTGTILSTVDTATPVFSISSFIEHVPGKFDGEKVVERQSHLLYNGESDICMRDIRISDPTLRYKAVCRRHDESGCYINTEDEEEKEDNSRLEADGHLVLASGTLQHIISLCSVPRLNCVFICSYVQAIEYDAGAVRKDDVLITIAATNDLEKPLDIAASPTRIKNDPSVGFRAVDGDSSDLVRPMQMKVYKLRVLQTGETQEHGNILVCADQHKIYMYEIINEGKKLSLNKICDYKARGPGDDCSGNAHGPSHIIDFGVCLENTACPILIIALKHKLLAFKLAEVSTFKDFKQNDDLCAHALKFRDKDQNKSVEMKKAVESLKSLTSMTCFEDPTAPHPVLQSPELKIGQIKTAEITVCCGFGDGSICVIECEVFESVLLLERRSNSNDIRIIKGHQDEVSCLTHFVYRRAPGEKGLHCALVSGGVDSTINIWDISNNYKFKSMAEGAVKGMERAVSALTVLNNMQSQDTIGIDVSIMSANEDGVIYVWHFVGVSTAVLTLVRRHLGGHGDHSSITSLDFSNMYAFDDTNRSYNDDFARLCAESEGHHIRKEGLIDRGTFLLSCDRDHLNIWVTGDGVNSSTCSNAAKRLASVDELQIAFDFDLRGYERGEAPISMKQVGKTASIDTINRLAAARRKIASSRSTIGSFTDGGNPCLCPFECFGQLIQDPESASKVLGWHGVKFFVEAVNPSAGSKRGVHWNFVDMFLPKCPEALLRDELRFINLRADTSRTAHSILALAVQAEPKKMKSVRVIINCWIELMNIKPDQAYDQVYLRSLFMPKEDVLMLARECPQEFEHFVSELKVMHAHPLVYGEYELFYFSNFKAKVKGSHQMWATSGRWSEEQKEAQRFMAHRILEDRREEEDLEDMRLEFRPLEMKSYVRWYNVVVVPFAVHMLHHIRVLFLLEDKESLVLDSSNDRMVTGYFVPLVHCSDHDVLSAYVTACDNLMRNNIFKAPIVVVALRFAWKAYGRRFHLLLLYRFIWFVIIFGICCLSFGATGKGLPLDSKQRHNYQFMTLGYAPQFFLFLVNLSYVKDEIKLIYINTTGPGFGLLKHITSNIWNFINVFLYGCIFMGTSLRILMMRESDPSRICMACASILMAAKMLYFFRAFESTGRLISYLVKIIKGIYYFLIVLGLVLVGFAFAFWIIANGEAPLSPFSSLDGSLVTTFAYMMGQFDSSDFDGISVNQFANYIYVLYMIVSTIILLNLLIAIMGDIYASVEKNALAQFRWEQCNVIIANMFNIEKKAQAKGANQPLSVHVLKVQNPLDDESTTPSNEELGADVEPDFEASSADNKTPEQERVELLGAIAKLMKDQQADFKHEITTELTAQLLNQNAAPQPTRGFELPSPTPKAAVKGGKDRKFFPDEEPKSE